MQNETKQNLTGSRFLVYPAILALCATTFMGLTYLFDGKYVYSGIGTFIVAALLLLYFILPLRLQAGSSKSNSPKAWHRVLILTSGLMFCVLMIPTAHFCNIFTKREAIREAVVKSTDSGKDLFAAYEEYVTKRLRAYELDLNAAHHSRTSIANGKKHMTSVLYSSEYGVIKSKANLWFNYASKASVFNVFVVANLPKHEQQIEEWNSILNGYSMREFKDEQYAAEFEFLHPRAKDAILPLKEIRADYFTVELPNIWTFLILGIIYLFLLLPYFIQCIRSHNAPVEEEPGIIEETLNQTVAIDGESNYPTFTLDI